MARITDELREWTRTHTVNCSDNRIALVAIADRIDEEHERVRKSKADEIMMPFIAVHNPDGTHDGWVKLPVDADGEVWNVGDFVVGEVNPRNPKAIERMIWYGPDSGWQLETDNIIYPCPDRPRHHHAPTVEDVLREFAERYLDYEGVPSAGRRGIGEALMDEYAARLRLAGDAE